MVASVPVAVGVTVLVRRRGKVVTVMGPVPAVATLRRAVMVAVVKHVLMVVVRWLLDILALAYGSVADSSGFASFSLLKPLLL